MLRPATQRGHPADEAIATRGRDRRERQQPGDVLRGQDGRAHEQSAHRRHRRYAVDHVHRRGRAAMHQPPDPGDPHERQAGSPRRAQSGTTPMRAAPCSIRASACAKTCTTAPTVLSICHPGAPRNVSTWTGPSVPAHAIHSGRIRPARPRRTRPTAANSGRRREDRGQRERPDLGEAGDPEPALRPRSTAPRRRSASPPTASTTERRSRRRYRNGYQRKARPEQQVHQLPPAGPSPRRAPPRRRRRRARAGSTSGARSRPARCARRARRSRARVIGGYSTAKSAYGVALAAGDAMEAAHVARQHRATVAVGRALAECDADHGDPHEHEGDAAPEDHPAPRRHARPGNRSRRESLVRAARRPGRGA